MSSGNLISRNAHSKTKASFFAPAQLKTPAALNSRDYEKKRVAFNNHKYSFNVVKIGKS